MKHLKRAIPIVLALVMAFALSVSAWAVTAFKTFTAPGVRVELSDGNVDDTYVLSGEEHKSDLDAAVTAANSAADTYIDTSVPSTYHSTITIDSITISDQGNYTLTVAPEDPAPITINSGVTLTISDGSSAGDTYYVKGNGGTLVVSKGTVYAYGTFADVTVNGNGNLHLGEKYGTPSNTTATTVVNSGAVSAVSGGNLFVNMPEADSSHLTVNSTTTGTGTITITGGEHHVNTANGAPVVVDGAATVDVISTTRNSDLTVSGDESDVSARGTFDEVEISNGTLTLLKNGESDGATTTTKITHTGGTLNVVDGGNADITSSAVNTGVVNIIGNNNSLTLQSLATVNVSGTGNTVNVKSTPSGDSDYYGVNLTNDSGNNAVTVGANADTLVYSQFPDTTNLTVEGTATVRGFYASITLQNGGRIDLEQSATVTAGTGNGANNAGTVTFNGEYTATIEGTATSGVVTVIGDATSAATKNKTLIVNGGTVVADRAFKAITVNGGKLTLGEGDTSESAITLNGGTLTIENGTYKVFGGNSNTNEPGGNLTVKAGTVCAYGKFNAVKVGVESGSGKLYLGFNEKPEFDEYSETMSGRYTSYTTVNGGLSVSGTGIVLACGNAENSTVTIRKGAEGSSESPIVSITGNGGVVLGHHVTVTGSIAGRDGLTLTGINVSGNESRLAMFPGSSIVLSNDSGNSTLQGIVNDGTARLSDVTITLNGASSSDAAILNSKTLEIRASAGLDSSNYAVTTSAPTAASVNVTTAMGSALKSTNGTVKVYGAYKAARFESQDPANPALVVSSGTADLRCGEFVGKVQIAENAFQLPETNYYIDADGTTGTEYHQTVTDAVWAIQYFMGEAAGSAPTATSAQYVGGVYTLACDIDLRDYHETNVPGGYAYNSPGGLNEAVSNKQIQVAGVRTLDLDGYSITGHTAADVITKGSNDTALTIQNSGKKGVATSTGTNGSAITAQAGKNAIVLENGNVTVNVTTADIAINAAGAEKDAIKTANGTVTLTNAGARFFTLGNVEGKSVSITNNSDGKPYHVDTPANDVPNCAFFIYGDVKATGTAAAGTVTIDNQSAHGLVGIVKNITANGAVEITNGATTGEPDGVVLVGNNIDPGSLLITNYSKGKDFTYDNGEDQYEFKNAAVVIGDDIGERTGTPRPAGNVKFVNNADGGIVVDEIYSTGAVEITNGATTTTPATETTPAVTNYINTGYVKVGSTIDSASLTITNNAFVKVEVNVPAYSTTGFITVNGDITATGAVMIENLATGTIKTKAINAGANDVSITNGESNEYKGSIMVDGAITSKALTITNLASVEPDAVDYTGKITVTGAIGASGAVAIYNYDDGAITTAAITAGNSDVTIINWDDGKVETGKITTNDSGDVEIANLGNGTISAEPAIEIDAAGDVNIWNGGVTIEAINIPDLSSYATDEEKIEAVFQALVDALKPVENTGTITLGAVSGKSVEIDNYSSEDVTTAKITASTGDVVINNLGNGTVSTGDDPAEVKAESGDVTIVNGKVTPAATVDGDPTYTTGNVVTGKITGKVVTITNNSEDVGDTKAIATGAVTTDVGTGKESKITNNSTGTIEIKTDPDDAITKRGLGTLTIDNTVEGGKITIEGGNYGVKMAADGTVNIGDDEGEYDDGIDVYGKWFGIGVINGVLNVNGGEIRTDDGSPAQAAIYQGPNSTTNVNISGGKIRGYYGLKSQNGNITISGGEITGEVDAIQVFQSSSGTIKITGGTFTGVENGLYQAGGTITEISGGTFTGGTDGYGYWRESNVNVDQGKNQHIIRGGTFSGIKTLVANETLADLMVLDDNNEPKYTFVDAGTGEGDAKVTATVGTRELYTLASLTKDSTYTPYTILTGFVSPDTTGTKYTPSFTVVEREWYEIAIHGAGAAIGATDSTIEVATEGLTAGTDYNWSINNTTDKTVDYKMLYVKYGCDKDIVLTLTAVDEKDGNGEVTLARLLQKVASRDTLTYVKGEAGDPPVAAGFVDANYYGTLVNNGSSMLKLMPISRVEDEEPEPGEEPVEPPKYFTDYEIQVVSTEKRTLTVDIDNVKKLGKVEYKYVLDATDPEAIVNYSNPNEAAVAATERKDNETILVADGNFVELTFTPDSTESAHSVHSVALAETANGTLTAYTEPDLQVTTAVTQYYTANNGNDTLNVEFCATAAPTASATASSTSVTTGTTVTLTGAVTPKDAHKMPVAEHKWTQEAGDLKDNAAVTLTNENAEKATVKSTKAGTLTLKYTATFADESTVYNTVTITFTAPTSSGPSSGGSSAPAPTASLSGDDNSVRIGVSTSNGTATMSEPKAADLEKVIGAGVDTGEVVIDMSKLSGGIDTATIPTKTFDSIEAAVTDASNDAEKLTIKLPASSVTFNAAALDAIADQATGATISLEVSKEAVSTLTTAQRDAVKDLDVQDVYSITLTSGGKTISDFEGGSATVTVNYTLKAGQNARGIVVWYVANDGTLTEVPATFSNGKVTFTVSHFSNYVIAYDAARAEACPQDDTCPMAAFSDADPKAWYHEGVHWAIENGVMSGMGNGIFAPNGTTTRAMVVQILWNIEGNPAYVGMSEYADVDNEAWFGPAVRWASAEGIVEGYANPDGAGSIFKPNTAVTREQLATILYRYAKYKGYDVSVGEDTNILSYEDAFSVSDWAMAAMQWACGAGVIQGSEVGNTIYLLPKNNATRAQVATMIARFCTQVAK